MNKKIKMKVLILIFIVIIETFFVKIFMHRLLPEKFFYDSYGFIQLMETKSEVDVSRNFTANFFNRINIFEFNNIDQWSWALSAVFTIIIIKIILKNSDYNWTQFFYIIMSVALLNIYVFNIGKDMIQFVIVLILYVILKSNKSNNIKVVLCFLVLCIEAIFFRIHYFIMALLILTIYIIYKYSAEKKNINNKNIIKIVFLGIILFFVQIYILQKISISNYNSIMYARSSVNINRVGSTDANTIIIELFGNNTNFYKFIFNYITVFIRLLFPIELLFKGFIYILFIIYQLIITLNLLRFKNKINNNNIVWLIVISSFFMTSAIFEPDFGSFIRHESTMFLIILHILILLKNEKIEKGE